MSSAAIRTAPPANPANAVVATAQVFSLASNSALACSVGASGKRAVEGKRFRVRAEGNLYTTVGTTTAKPQLLAFAGSLPPASPLVIGSWTQLSAGGAQASPTTGCPWWVEADLIMDSYSGLLSGVITQLVNNTYVAPAAITAVTGLNGTNSPVGSIQPSDPVITFAVAMTFSAAAANVANLMNFEVSF